jgi:hypothetical protein
MNKEQLKDELWEIIEHFHKLDFKAQNDYQIITMEDLDKIDWLIDTCKQLLNIK